MKKIKKYFFLSRLQTTVGAQEVEPRDIPLKPFEDIPYPKGKNIVQGKPKKNCEMIVVFFLFKKIV